MGYESNEDVDNGHRPGGLIRLSTTTGAVSEYLQDFGNTVAPGTTTHHLTLYRAPSGALVFSAGSVQWAWGLDAVHDSGYAPEPADPRMQQAQVNLFADMGVQPGSLAAGLVAAARSADTTGPAVAITSPAAGASMPNGQSVTVAGTASDAGGGVVAGVEVSTDGGGSWHAANGTTSWSYTFLQHGVGSTPVRVRAMDDSANIGAVATRSFAVQCPCSIFGAEVPPVASAADTSAVELGVRFVAQADGFVTGVRFYKGAANTGTHTGSLWAANGQRLAQATFGTETATGWQSVAFDTPVAVAAGQAYIASYTAPRGGYAVKSWAFAGGPQESGALMVEGGFGAPAGGVYSPPGTVPEPELPERQLLRRRHLHHHRQLPADRGGSVAAAGLVQRPARHQGECALLQAVGHRHGRAGPHRRQRHQHRGHHDLRPRDADGDLHPRSPARRVREVHRHRVRHRHQRQPRHDRQHLVLHHRQAAQPGPCPAAHPGAAAHPGPAARPGPATHPGPAARTWPRCADHLVPPVHRRQGPPQGGLRPEAHALPGARLGW